MLYVQLLELLLKHDVWKLQITASGSGDEGCINDATCFANEEDFVGMEVPELQGEIEEIVSEIFEGIGYDYSTGDGGYITLTIITDARTYELETGYYYTESRVDATEVGEI